MVGIRSVPLEVRQIKSKNAPQHTSRVQSCATYRGISREIGEGLEKWRIEEPLLTCG